jgi:hypothetical protein
MPFDAGELDATTLLLLRLRDRLTAENWRPHVSNAVDFDEGRGCMLQQLWYTYRYASGRRYDSKGYNEAICRLKDAVGVPDTTDLGKFNDSHSLEEVQAVVDKAIGG